MSTPNADGNSIPGSSSRQELFNPNPVGAGRQQTTSEKVTIKYSIENEGKPNERVVIVSELNQPGQYTFNTSGSNSVVGPSVSPATKKTLDEAVTFAAGMLTDVSSFFEA